jgi:hypothetical protein
MDAVDSPWAVATAAVAVVGSLVAIGATVENWLLPARRKRQQELFHALSETEPVGPRRAALRDAHDNAAANQLAAYWVPHRTVALSIGLAAAICTWIFLWMVDQDKPTSAAVELALVIGMSIGAAISATVALADYRQRLHIVRRYIDNDDPVVRPHRWTRDLAVEDVVISGACVTAVVLGFAGWHAWGSGAELGQGSVMISAMGVITYGLRFRSVRDQVLPPPTAARGRGPSPGRRQ